MTQPEFRPEAAGTPLLDRALASVASALNLLAVAAGVAVLVLMTLSVIMRYLVGAPFRFTEELVGLLMTSMVFLTLPLTQVQDTNIRSTVLTDRLPPRGRRIAAVVSECVMLGFAAIFAWESWKASAFTIRLGLKTEAASLPLAPWMVAMTAAMILCGVLALVALVRRKAP